jgi:hypothetical protein
MRKATRRPPAWLAFLDAEEIVDNRIDTFGSIGALSMRALAVRVIGLVWYSRNSGAKFGTGDHCIGSNLVALRRGAVGKL